ncbi:MAG: hypothetical protein FJZ59_00085 [Chlamydiae bacterium]|nr:hypothetical protein [Chlamydiota bacterium]
MEEDGLHDLEKEVLCLRELLSRLKMEESYLIQGSTTHTSIQDNGELKKESLLLQKKRKALLLNKSSIFDVPEITVYLEQISSLKKKIGEQKKINSDLKKRSLYPLQKIRPKAKIKKKPLLLEDQNA